MADLPAERLSDEDRDRAVTLLREHCVAGRLSLDEFSERVGAALVARTGADLAPVLGDLPARTAAPASTPRSRRRVVAVMSGTKAAGRWRLGARTTAVAVMGGCTLDLRRAEVEGAEVRITAIAFWGGIDIIVPEGIAVDMTGISIMGGKAVKVRDVPVVPGSPRVTIRAFPIMGGVSVRSARTSSKEHPMVDAGGPGAPWPVATAGRVATAGTVAGSATAPAAHPGAAKSSDVPIEESMTLAAARAEAPSEDGTMTFLFSDISNYSGLTERLGDRGVARLLVEHHALVRRCIAANGGTEVKVQGDGFMIAFTGVGRALRCATAIQRELAAAPVGDGEPLAVHMGVHTGEALLEGTDYTGRTVIVASRLADQAGAGQVLVSELARLMVDRSGEFEFGPPRSVQLKGLDRPEAVAELLWHDGRPAPDPRAGGPGERSGREVTGPGEAASGPRPGDRTRA